MIFLKYWRRNLDPRQDFGWAKIRPLAAGSAEVLTAEPV
jgi:hypothetical protein